MLASDSVAVAACVLLTTIACTTVAPAVTAGGFQPSSLEVRASRSDVRCFGHLDPIPTGCKARWATESGPTDPNQDGERMTGHGGKDLACGEQIKFCGAWVICDCSAPAAITLQPDGGTTSR